MVAGNAASKEVQEVRRNEVKNTNVNLKKPTLISKVKGRNNPIKPMEAGNNSLNFPIQESQSEATIYKRAVQQFEPTLNEQIEGYIETVCSSLNQNVSSSSDEVMDTSNESGQALVIDANNLSDLREAGTSRRNEPANKTVTQEQHAEQIIRDSEKSKVRLYEVQGKVLNFAQRTAQMDKDYQMIDTHVDDITRRKIWCYEYIDFSKLISRSKAFNEEAEHRMEIVSCNGYTFLSPISERDAVQINSFGQWEQAFRVFSNILTSKYPAKAPELLQYNHTIHSASTTYTWENVYSYDKEFRRHVSRHPARSWSVILQQAWTMLLKDRAT